MTPSSSPDRKASRAFDERFLSNRGFLVLSLICVLLLWVVAASGSSVSPEASKPASEPSYVFGTRDIALAESFLHGGPAWFINLFGTDDLFFSGTPFFARYTARTLPTVSSPETAANSGATLQDPGVRFSPFDLSLVSSSYVAPSFGGPKTADSTFAAEISAITAWNSTSNTSWNSSGNWTNGAPNAATFLAQFAAVTNSNASPANTTGIPGTTWTVGAVEMTSARTASMTVGASGTTSSTLTLTLAGGTVNAVANTILRNNSSPNLTFQANNGQSTPNTLNIALGNSTSNVVNIDSSGNIVVGVNITGSGKQLTLNANSTGDLRLSGSNSYDGGTTVNGGAAGGRLRIDAVAALPTTGTVAVNNGGRLTLNIAGTYGGLTQALTFDPNQTTNPSLDTLSGAAVTWQGTVAINADTRIEANGSGGSLTFSGNLSGSGTLIKQAAGNLILSGTGNAANGGTQIGNGTITVSSGSNLGTGDVTMFQTSTNNTALIFNNATQNIGNLSSQFTATSGTQTQTVTLNGTALNISQTTNSSFGTGSVSTLTSTITGSGSVALSNTSTGKLTLTDANTYTGTTTISGGTLEIANDGSTTAGRIGSTNRTTVNGGGTLLLSGAGSADRINNAAPITLAAGGKLQLNGVSEGSTAAAGVGALTLTSGGIIDLASTSLLHLAASGSQTWSGTLSIYNWSGTRVTGGAAEQLLFGVDTSTTSLTQTQLNMIDFYSDNGSTFLGTAGWATAGNGEVVPVPEPATWVAAGLALAALALTARQRVRSSATSQ